MSGSSNQPDSTFTRARFDLFNDRPNDEKGTAYTAPRNTKLLYVFRLSFVLTMCWITMLTYGFVLLLTESVKQEQGTPGSAASIFPAPPGADNMIQDPATLSRQQIPPKPKVVQKKIQGGESPMVILEKALNGNRQAMAMVSIGIGALFSVLFGFATVGLFVLLER